MSPLAILASSTLTQVQILVGPNPLASWGDLGPANPAGIYALIALPRHSLGY